LFTDISYTQLAASELNNSSEKTCCYKSIFKAVLILASGLLLVFMTIQLIPPARSWVRRTVTDRHGRVMMGTVNRDCDDGKNNLDVDWDGDETDMACGDEEEVVSLDGNMEQRVDCVTIPESYFPFHYCMNETITYEEFNRIPRYGPHRPVWPVFGEYEYVPVQRWLHNIEHGAVVLLYHPCVDQYQLDVVKDIIRDCIRKHIITPSRLVLPSAPIALVAWGCILELSSLDESLIKRFVKEKGLHGPEGHLPKQGQYEHLLLKKAEPPLGSDINDTVLCPEGEQKWAVPGYS